MVEQFGTNRRKLLVLALRQSAEIRVDDLPLANRQRGREPKRVPTTAEGTPNDLIGWMKMSRRPPVEMARMLGGRRAIERGKARRDSSAVESGDRRPCGSNRFGALKERRRRWQNLAEC